MLVVFITGQESSHYAATAWVWSSVVSSTVQESSPAVAVLKICRQSMDPGLVRLREEGSSFFDCVTSLPYVNWQGQKVKLHCLTFLICLKVFFTENERFSMFFPRASERRVLPIVGFCLSSSHLHIFSSSHLLLIFCSSSHLHIFSSSHLHILTSSHLLLLPSCPLVLLPSCPLALPLALLPSCPLALPLALLPSPSFIFLF